MRSTCASWCKKVKMRILFLLTQDLESPSGLGRYWPMGRELARRGHQVQISTLHSNYEQLTPRRFLREGVIVDYVAPMHVRKLGSLKTYYGAPGLLAISARATLALGKAAVSAPADIIHIGKPHPMNSLAGLAGRLLRGRRVFLDCDDYEAGVGHFSARWQKQVVAWFEKWMPFRVEHITTNTYYTRQRLLESGVAEPKIKYISNGVERERFPAPDPARLEQLRLALGLAGRSVVGFVGSLGRPGHPVELLFQAFSRLIAQHPQTTLLMVGGGEDLPHLQELAQQMGVGDSIVFTGRIPPEQVFLYYRLADVQVDPVLDDGAARGRSPLKLFESWACGVPFVSAAVGDRALLLGDPPAGLLAIPGDALSLADNLAQVLTNPNLAQDLKQRGLLRVQEYFWDRIAEQLVSVYLPEGSPAA